MYIFVPTIREHRRNEMNTHKEYGIEFIKENDYKLVEKIYIAKNEIKFTFEVRVDFREVRFYITKNGSCIYLSIYEIYSLLNDIYLNSDIDISGELKKVYDNAKDKFVCKGSEYEFPKSSYIEDHYQVDIPNSNLAISYNELLLLIFLIQEKSNYLCSISEEMNIYKNGLINMLITLLECREDNVYLKDMGWNYSPVKSKYLENTLRNINNDDISDDERKKLVEKYYLTEMQMKSILKI